jgi:hypothetical protein
MHCISANSDDEHDNINNNNNNNNVSLVLNEEPQDEPLRRMEVQLHAFLSSALDGGEC